MNYIITVQVRYSVNVNDAPIAYEIAKEKAIELADIVGDYGAFETEASKDILIDYDQSDG